MAQMTRQLKLGLSQIPRGKSNGSSGTDSGASSMKRAAADSSQLLAETSPLKKQSVSPVKKELNHPSSPESTNSSTSPIKITPSTPGRSTNNNHISKNNISGGHLNKFLTTPKRKISSKKDPGNNDSGADLLMYLATSPYTSKSGASNLPPSSVSNPTNNPLSNSKFNNLMRIPTTPSSSSYMNNHISNDDAIRLSNMKTSLSSPQSTFKVPQSISNNAHASLSYPDVLMESPSLYLGSNLISPQKKRQSQQSQQQTLLPNIPTTPSRESINTTTNNNTNTTNNNMSFNLLKTPNFNMGDYIHNLFSPSPNVTSQTSSLLSPNQLNNTSMNMRKTSMLSETNDNAFNGLLGGTSNKSQQLPNHN